MHFVAFAPKEGCELELMVAPSASSRRCTHKPSFSSFTFYALRHRVCVFSYPLGVDVDDGVETKRGLLRASGLDESRAVVVEPTDPSAWIMLRPRNSTCLSLSLSFNPQMQFAVLSIYLSMYFILQFICCTNFLHHLLSHLFYFFEFFGFSFFSYFQESLVFYFFIYLFLCVFFLLSLESIFVATESQNSRVEVSTFFVCLFVWIKKKKVCGLTDYSRKCNF